MDRMRRGVRMAWLMIAAAAFLTSAGPSAVAGLCDIGAAGSCIGGGSGGGVWDYLNCVAGASYYFGYQTVSLDLVVGSVGFFAYSYCYAGPLGGGAHYQKILLHGYVLGQAASLTYEAYDPVGFEPGACTVTLRISTPAAGSTTYSVPCPVALPPLPWGLVP